MAVTAATAKNYANYYTTKWASKNDVLYKPEVLKTMYEIYGDGFRLFDFLTIAEKETSVPNETITHLEAYAPWSLITLGTAIAVTAAGGNISFKVAAADYDANNNCFLRVGDTVYVPSSYQADGIHTDRAYRVYSTAGSGTDVIYTCYPFNAAGTYQTASEVGTQVPAATKLRVGHTSWAPGTGQPTAKSEDYASRTHKAIVLKETTGIEGGQIARSFYEAYEMQKKKRAGGGSALVNKALFEAEFKLDAQIDDYILMGERDDNSNLVGTSNQGGSNTISSGFGLWQWQEQLAQKHWYVQNNFTIDDFDDFKDYLQGQGLTTNKLWFCYGPDLGTQIENAGLDFLQEFSGGTDLYRKGKEIGIDFKVVHKNGNYFMLNELVSFANVNSYGWSAYSFRESGMVIPEGYVAVNDPVTKAKRNIKNLTLGYVNNNGENRSRILAPVAGVAGAAIGLPVSNEYDTMYWYLLSHVMLIAANVNQHIMVRPDNINTSA